MFVYMPHMIFSSFSRFFQYTQLPAYFCGLTVNGFSAIEFPLEFHSRFKMHAQNRITKSFSTFTIHHSIIMPVCWVIKMSYKHFTLTLSFRNFFLCFPAFFIFSFFSSLFLGYHDFFLFFVFLFL